MKRLGALAVASLIAIAGLAGCSNSAKTDAASGDSGAGKPDVAAFCAAQQEFIDAARSFTDNLNGAAEKAGGDVEKMLQLMNEELRTLIPPLQKIVASAPEDLKEPYKKIVDVLNEQVENHEFSPESFDKFQESSAAALEADRKAVEFIQKNCPNIK